MKSVAVAASANLQFAFEPIERAFEEQNPDLDLVVTYGSSGNFYSQLSQRAPYDIFFSADADYPKRLQRGGFAPTDGYFAYAKGRLVIWVANDSPLDLESLGAEALADPSIGKIAIANPALAPYGAAAESAMRHLGIYESVQDRLVFGENVSQVGHFVFSGAADAGIIASSLALAPPMQEKGRSWEIPPDAYEPIEQAGVVLSSSKHFDAAERLRVFVTGEQGQQILKRYGYTPINE